MRTFPKFLKAMPEFLGMNFYDLGMILASLYISMFLKLEPVTTLIVCGTFIIVFKIIRKNCDLTGFFLPRRKEISLKSTKRGQDDATL